MDFQLNGKNYSSDDVLKLDPGGFPEFEQKVFAIIREWLSGQNTFVFQTSGSTGKPKAARFSRKQISASVKRTANAFELEKGNVVLCCLNPQFVAGYMMIIRAIELGLHLLIQEPSGNPLKALGHTRIDFVAMTPNQVRQSIIASKERFQQIGKVLIGGADISPILESSLQQLKVRAFHSYAMTETLTHVALRDITNAARAYRALEGVRFGQREDGCLIVNDEMLGIHQLQTNDVVDLIDPWTFKWKGRIDHVINTGGVKVHVEELEGMIEEILQLEGLDWPFCVLAKPDDTLTNQLVLILENKNWNFDRERILSLLKSGLPRYHDPKQIIIVRDLLKTPTGKIDRAANSKAYL